MCMRVCVWVSVWVSVWGCVYACGCVLCVYVYVRFRRMCEFACGLVCVFWVSKYRFG